MKTTTKLFCSLAAVGAALSAACSKSSSSTAASTTSYAGPGSHYTVTSTDNTYTISKFANTSSTSASFVVTATGSNVNGFKKFAVSSVTGSGGPSAGSSAYGLEVPGMALFIKPIDTSNPDQVIAAVASGTCPTSNINANWIIVKQSGSSNVSSASQDTFGTFTYATTSGIASVAKRFSLASTTTDLGPNTFSAATCSNGIMSVSVGGDTAVMYLTSVGGAIVNTASTNSSDASYIFALPQASITGSSYSGTYSGFVYMGSQSTGSKFKAIKFTVTGGTSSITGSGNMVTDIDADTTGSETVSLNLTALNSPVTGMMTGTLTSPGGSSTVACMAVANANSSGKQIINCAGADPGSSSKLFNFIMVSR
jgi:hypothetical protein